MIIITDNNKWISSNTRLPYNLSSIEEAVWDTVGPTDPNAIANPGYGQQITIASATPLPNPATISGLSFVKRFTTAERAAIVNSSDPIVKAFAFELQIAAAGSEIDLLDTDTIAGTQYLETTATLIAAGRAAQILTP